jgi:CMP-N,N'-diacetyllegionaminic acid synthase
MTVLGLVTARAGSKGVPGKNLKPLNGRPLLAYTIEAARASGVLHRLVLSTEDEEIASVGRALGCEVPFTRPQALAHDETPHLPVILHAVQWLAEHEGYRPDAVMILQPTSPLRAAADIQASVALLASSAADSVLSVSEVPAHFHPMRTLSLDAEGDARLLVTGEPVRRRINRRQDLPEAWVMNGAIYCCRIRVLDSTEPSLYGDRVLAYRMPASRGLSIDDADDWKAAERALQR